MGYIDRLIELDRMTPAEQRRRFKKFYNDTRPRGENNIVRINILRAMAFAGETNFSDEAQQCFIDDYNVMQDADENPCAMIRITGEFGGKETLIVRLPARGTLIAEAKIEDDSIYMGHAEL